MGGRVGTRRLGEGVGEAGEGLQSDRVGLMSRREIERLRSRLELQSGLCFRVSGCSLDYASSAELQGFDRMSHRKLVCNRESSDGFEERESR
jgi:hypothetical protein